MNRVCPVCHTEYLPWSERCTTCGVATVEAGDPADPLSLPEELQVVYELQSWPVDLQALAAEAMAESEIPHAWNGPELVVHVEHEAAVDAVLDAIEAEHGPIVPAPVHLADDPDLEQTEYDLAEWSEADVAKVGTLLAEGGIAHRWEARVLIVREEDEEVVEPLLDSVEFPDELAPAPDGDDGGADDAERAEQLSELFLAADRLRSNGADPEGIAGLVAVLEQTDPARPPYGVDERAWAQFVEEADGIADVLIDEELSDPERAEAVEERADALRERLRPYV